jgi:spermidine synthase
LRSPTRSLCFLFALSGFAGIIYEALWSHYLKLFLGHAAYAQAAVLVLFMGGLCGGAMLATRADARDPLLRYAIVEIAIGVSALIFHPLYVVTIAGVQTWLPLLLASGVSFVKFAVSGALILPQALLIGATFPLMTTGVLRRASTGAGTDIAGLYFLNSLGAAIGVLAATFLLKPWLGLPGTLCVAGLLNILVAVGVLWWRQMAVTESSATTNSPTRPVRSPNIGTSLLIVAALTGASSFIYEIVWIRMLSIVLGSTTHSFEIMLFTFILGLALGGRWIRRGIDHLQSPVTTLAFIQLAMAALALTSLAFYDFSFDALALTLTALARTSTGYVVFIFVGVVLAMLIMLPTTICAGMTLPIITARLYATEQGERAVGRVYAANTGGAIAAVVLTQFVLIPLLGLRNSLVVGAIIDLLLGVWLLRTVGLPLIKRQAWMAVIAALGFACVAISLFHFDPRKISSGVFRTGVARLSDDVKINFLRDGKTATVAVFTRDQTHRVIATNGKPDAGMELNPQLPATIDEATQVLSGVLPLAAHPNAKTAAVIGIGSGMTTHILLQDRNIERVDTIEIESAMIDGARLFLPHVEATFSDPRSTLVIDDARSYFSTHHRQYDLIVSEPSNPWVSGVSGLFTREFYQLLKHKLAADGVFAQWMQLYEMNLELVASVFKALAAEFGEIRVYEMGDGNFLLMAYRQPKPLEDFDESIGNPSLLRHLWRVGIETADDLSARFVGDRALLAPLFDSYATPANSDFRPVLDEQAPQARFMRQSAMVISDLTRAPWPLREILGGEALRSEGVSDLSAERYRTNRVLRDAHAIYAYLTDSRQQRNGVGGLDANLQRELAFLLAASTECGSSTGYAAWRDAFVTIAGRVLPALGADAGVDVLTRLASHPCAQNAAGAQWLDFYRALARRDTSALKDFAAKLVTSDPSAAATYSSLLVGALLLDRASTGRGEEAENIMAGLEPAVRLGAERNLLVRLLIAHSEKYE